MKNLYFCDCGEHGLTVTQDEDEKCIYIDMWKVYAGHGKLDWRQRLRWIKEILFNGEPFVGEVVLEAEEAIAFFKEATSLAQELVSEEQQTPGKRVAGFSGKARPEAPERPS